MDAVLGFLNNPLVLLAVGLIVKFVPGVRSVIANKLIPYLTTIIAWLSGLLGPAEAHAAAGPLAMPLVVFGLGGPLAGLGAAIWQSAQAWVLHEFLVRGVTKKPADSR